MARLVLPEELDVGDRTYGIEVDAEPLNQFPDRLGVVGLLRLVDVVVPAVPQPLIGFPGKSVGPEGLTVVGPDEPCVALLGAAVQLLDMAWGDGIGAGPAVAEDRPTHGRLPGRLE